MAARPLLLLSVLLGGLLVLKGLNLADDAAAVLSSVVSERAFAAESAQEPADDDGEDPSQEDEAAPIPPPPDPREAARRELPTASRIGLERNLAQRRRELDQREATLDTREQLLVVAEQRMDSRITRLETLRDEVQALLGQLNAQREQQINQIVDTYAQLEPDAAAGILTAMRQSDPDTLLLVAQRLQGANPRKFAGILTEMRPDIAAELTTNLRARAETADASIEAEARRAAAEG